MAQLVFQSAFIGDALLSSVLLKNLKKIYPDQELHIVCRPPVADLFEEYGLVDRAFPLDKSMKSSWASLKNRLSSYEYENIWCPHESFRSARFVKSIKAQHRIGFYSWWNFLFFDQRVRRDMSLPDALRQLSLLSTLGEKWPYASELSQYPNPNDRQSFGFDESLPQWADMKIEVSGGINILQALGVADAKKPFVCLAPGSVWATKKWGDKNFLKLAEQLAARGLRVFLVGSSAEAETCDWISEKVEAATSLAGRTSLADLGRILKEAQFAVTNDSGTMHLASLVGCPTVSIFGPTTLDLGYRPWQSQAKVIQKDLGCRPCGKHGHQKCPIGTHECMKSITADEVFEATQGFIKL